MTIMSETNHVHVIKFNTNLNKNRNKSKKHNADIGMYTEVRPLPEAAVVRSPAGGVDMLLLDWLCSV